jgi:hypothetical protein
MLKMMRQFLEFPECEYVDSNKERELNVEYEYVRQTKNAATEYSDMYPSLNIEVNEVIHFETSYI